MRRRGARGHGGERMTTRLHRATCPTCGRDITVTYEPYNVPRYTTHTVPDDPGSEEFEREAARDH